MNAASVRIVLVAIVSFFPLAAFGWNGPPTHSILATAEFADPVVAPLAAQFLTPAQISAITSFTGEPPQTPINYHHPDQAAAPYTIPNGFWHSVMQNRLYALAPSVYAPYVQGVQGAPTSLWPQLDEVTKLQYLVHLSNDAGVPVDHGPAGEVYSTGTFPEAVLETLTALSFQYPGAPSGWSYPQVAGTTQFNYTYTNAGQDGNNNPITGISASYTGTFNDVWQAHYNAETQNVALWFKSRPDGTVYPSGLPSPPYPAYVNGKSLVDNFDAAKVGTTLAEMFGRAFLVDYFLSKEPVVAVAGTAYTVNAGDSVTLSSAGSLDPASVTWAANGTYANNGGGLAALDWDINGDGIYGDVTGASPTLTYSQLIAMLGNSTGGTIGLRVTTVEGNVGYGSATLSVVPEPGTLIMLLGGALALAAVRLIRRRS
jgi:hypothetical protein